jgi:hypothetical protein
MSKELLEATRTSAGKDKHLWATLLFVGIVCVNHRWQLALTPGELMVLGAVLGTYMGQSQLGQWAKLRELMSAPQSLGGPPDVAPKS